MSTAAQADDVVTCPHGVECGACGLLQVRYQEQMERKRALVIASLSRARIAQVAVLPCLASPRIQGYRNRAKMAVRIGPGGKRRVRLGYYKARSTDVVDAPDCRVLLPEVLETTRALRGVLETRPRSFEGLRFVDVRAGSDPDRQHLTLVLDAREVPRLPLDAIASACPRVAGISANLNPGGGPQVLKGPVRCLRGDRDLAVEMAGVRLHVSPASFFQVNPFMLAPLHERLAAFFAGARALVDLYAGVGTHLFALQKLGFARSLMVEGVPAAVKDARTTLEENGFPNAYVYGSPVERALARVAAEHADAVLLNPSRQGARPDVLNAIAASDARRVAYLSCEPETLARDLEILVRGRFRLRSVEPIDMMPQTLQVEALALLSRS